MDPMDILGGLLGGGKRGGGGLGGSILTDLLGGGRKKSPPPPSKSSGNGPSRRPVDLDQRAQELEDMLGVAKDRYSKYDSSRAESKQYSPPRQQAPSNSSNSGRQTSEFNFDTRPPVGRRELPDQNEQAVIFIRAMICAAQSDGRISETEQNEILQRLSNPSQQAIEFLRREFQRSTTARDFAWDVPIGLEEKVYTMSLAAIDVDTRGEMQYLRELAHGLRLSAEDCNQIHRQFGVRELH